MRYEGRRHTSYGLNLTPLIDILFLLLVFFMLTAHFVREETLDVQLPTAESGNHLETEEVLEAVIDSDGRVAVAGRNVTLEGLEETFRAGLSATSEKRVRLRGDRGTDLGLVVTVMDAARKAGASSLDIITEQP